MDKIDLYRGSNLGEKSGKWWSPNPSHAQKYRKLYGPLGAYGKMSKTPSVSIDDFRTGVLSANQEHLDTAKFLKERHGYQSEITRPSNIELGKQFDSDLNAVRSGKMDEIDFKNKYYEGVIDLPSKINYGQTFGVPLKAAARFAGPLGLVYGALEYLSGTPTSTEADLYPNWKYDDD